MRIQCTKENLIRALDSVVSITRKGGNLPILSYLLLIANNDGIKIQGTNLEVALEFNIRGKVEKYGSAALPAKLFSDVIRGLNGVLDIQGNYSELTIHGEKSRIVVHGLPDEEFPPIPWFSEGIKISVSAQNILNALKSTLYAAAHDNQRPELQSISLMNSKNGLAIASTDGFRLSEVIIPLNNEIKESFQILIPLNTAQILEKVIEKTEDTVHFLIKDFEVLIQFEYNRLYSRLIQGKYPDYNAIFPQNITFICAFPTKDLLYGIKSASLFCRPGINDILFSISGNSCIISGKSEVTGVSENEVEVISDGSDFKAVFNFRYVQDAVVNNGAEWIVFLATHSHQPVLFLPLDQRPDIKTLNKIKEDLSIYPRKSIVMPIRQ